MKTRMRRAVVIGMMAFSGGFVCASIGNGCAAFSGEQALIATDFCFIFDCQTGAFGGIIQPCDGVAGTNNEQPGRRPLLVDCVTPEP